jgi:hypothetical protein
MSSLLLAPYVRVTNRYQDAREQLLVVVRGGWKDEDGLDDSVVKMIWLGAAVIVGTVAVAFAITIFNSAKNNVPTPTPATP